jgi:CRISPR system Cascade subunit CasA
MGMYDILVEPWIPVEDFEGKLVDLGLLATLQGCQSFERLSDSSPIFEYGIFRFLTVFLMDAYRPESNQDLQDLFDRGCFDMEVINRYVADCRIEGCSFNLLDPERPFLQATFNPQYDIREKSVAELFFDYPTGNNTVHFDHNLEDSCEASLKDCLKALTTLTAFSVAGTGRVSSVNGAPPVYFAIKGKNLFETLVLGMIPFSNTSLSIDTPPVLWRNPDDVVPDKATPDTSLLFGMTFPCRRVVVIPENGKSTIRKVYFQKGLHFLGYDGWTDPHVAYVFGDNGRSSIKPKISKEIWRDIGNIFMLSSGAPSILKNYSSIVPDDRVLIPIVTYSFVTSTSSGYEHWQRSELSLDSRIIEDNEKIQVLADCIGRMETMGGKTKLMASLKAIVSKSKNGNLYETTMTSFYSACRERFFGWLCPVLVSSDSYVEVRDTWTDFVLKEVLHKFEEAVDSLGNDAKHLASSAKEASKLRAQLYKFCKEVKQDGN